MRQIILVFMNVYSKNIGNKKIQITCKTQITPQVRVASIWHFDYLTYRDCSESPNVPNIFQLFVSLKIPQTPSNYLHVRMLALQQNTWALEMAHSLDALYMRSQMSNFAENVLDAIVCRQNATTERHLGSSCTFAG